MSWARTDQSLLGSLARLAAFVAGQTCVSIEVTQGYSAADFRNDLREIIRQVTVTTCLCVLQITWCPAPLVVSACGLQRTC